ncbi:sentrin-specific protease 1-like isoform X1 [Orbicella faveolata]|uniref:sentrin-specific protease 1-like isoform X1 n=1 Tax=Orbicella faveolata TaxID=48498 RepID=UPI0009E2EA3E|nr:sentrin-specific protease 1-like isoform X1 [Orbicella faveolata]
MLASLSSFYDNIRSYSLSGRKPGDKRRREREDDVVITDVLQTPPAKRLRNIEGAAHESSNNSPIQSFSDFVKKVKSWSGRYFWQYVVKGETLDDGKSSLRRDLNDAEDEMEKIRCSTSTRSTSSALTNEWRHQGSPGLTRRPLNKSRGPETSTPARSCNKSNRKGLLTSTRQSKSVTESSGRVYDPSRYEDTSGSTSTSYKVMQYKIGSTKGRSSPRPQSNGRSVPRPKSQIHSAAAKKSPGDRDRFISTAERVVRLDERDRYKQLVAQFTTIQTPESVGTSWNRTVAEPLQVDTDFLTKTRSHGRSENGSLLSPRSSLLPPSVSFTVPASAPQSSTRLRVMASPRRSVNRSRQATSDVSLYSRPGPIEVSPPSSSYQSRTLDTPAVCNPFDEDWTRKWRDLLSDESLSRQREISKEEKKLQALKQKREEDTQALKEKIQHRLRRVKQGFDEEEETEGEEEVEEGTDSFVPLTNEMERMVDSALAPGYSEDPLVEGFRVTLKRSDLATLSNLNWLNDEIINFFFNLLVERSNQEGKVKVHAFNSFFYPKLVKSGYASLKRWTKKVIRFVLYHSLALFHSWSFCEL